ncbi:MAG: CFI-box-CTERM domain-containing protein [Pseudobdellovibrionaceae bacterium]
MSTPCPRCGNPADEMQIIDPALMAKLAEAGHAGLPAQVCNNCFSELAGGVARGSVLLAREKAKEQKKLMLWKSRVNLIKKARQSMTDKSFSVAAVSYEKYLKVLEVVFDCKAGELTPEHFKDSARTQELTVVASVYWDLLRIYDTSERYGDRMKVAANKLALFLRFTPIYPDILRKAESFSRTARKPAIMKQFLKMSSEDKGKCFIATAAFESEEHPVVLSLRKFRDEVLLSTILGRCFVDFYYFVSPPIAKFLNICSSLKPLIRLILQGLANLLNRASRH